MEALEIIFIMFIILIVFGPDRLPEMARGLGKAVNEFKKASATLQQVINLPLEQPIIIKQKWIENELSSASASINENAKKLGIKTEEKNVTEIIDEILAELNKRKDQPLVEEEGVK